MPLIRSHRIKPTERKALSLTLALALTVALALALAQDIPFLINAIICFKIISINITINSTLAI